MDLIKVLKRAFGATTQGLKLKFLLKFFENRYGENRKSVV